MSARRSNSGLEIRGAKPKDATEIARLHAQLLPHGFFAKLGPRYLAVYHRSFMTSPHAVSLVACRDGRMVGMIAGCIDAHAHQHHTLRRRGLRLAISGTAALLWRPAIAFEFVTTRTGRYLKAAARASRRSSPPSSARTGALSGGTLAVLMHVAVEPTVQGCGAGSSLVEAFVERVRGAGVENIELVTLAEHGASLFYERLGWSPVDEHVREGAVYRRFRVAVV